MMLISLLVTVNLHDAELRFIVFQLIGEDADHSRLLLHRLCSDILCRLQIIFQVFWIDFYFSYSYYHTLLLYQWLNLTLKDTSFNYPVVWSICLTIVRRMADGIFASTQDAVDEMLHRDKPSPLPCQIPDVLLLYSPESTTCRCRAIGTWGKSASDC